MTAILVGRFLLNIQETNVRLRQAHTSASWDAGESTIRFEHRVLGSLGDPVTFSTFPSDSFVTGTQPELGGDAIKVDVLEPHPGGDVPGESWKVDQVVVR